ncbi:cysteine-rich CWC family protein [Luteolibacter sp. LG18]|uniref:cysteine-rich CWC family protein n=1 Tax=Luteolibacter sp. LG18 TaxID=2819286 RepID=UPI002B302194|nr:hypothetical protein llg_00620 [Luteolibacter sp. LG18]
MTTQASDPASCPLCGQNNHCGALLGVRCWCMDVTIPPALLDLVAEEDRRRACICRECVEKSSVSIPACEREE